MNSQGFIALECKHSLLACVRWFMGNVNMKEFLPNYKLLLQVSIKCMEISPIFRDSQRLFSTAGNWEESSLSNSW